MSITNKSFLEQMYYGEFFPCEAIKSLDPKYHPTQDQITAEKRYISNHLEVEQRDHFEHLFELLTEVNGMDSFANFVYGFRSGMLLMQELFEPVKKDIET